jgi:phospholipid/cholesterol/gamma-HCH transport system substrate-binding protein
MTLLADRDERFKGLFVKISIFVLLALVGIAFNFLYAALRQGVFLQKTPIYFVAPSSQDIHEGMAVKLSGFKIGTVKTMTLNEMAQTQVEVLIEDRYMHFLKEDADLTLTREGVIGDSVLAVNRGTESKGPLQAGAEIKFVQSGGLEQITQDLRDRLFPAINDVSKLLHDVNDPQGDIRMTLRNLREFSAGLNGTRQRLDRLLDHTDAAVSNDAHPMLQSLNKSSARLEQDLPGLLNKADATLDNLQKSSAVLKSALEVAGPQLSGLMGEGRELVSGARKTVDSLNNSWLLKSGVPSEQRGLIKMDSHD